MVSLFSFFQSASDSSISFRVSASITQLSTKEWGKLAQLEFIFYTLTKSAVFVALPYLPATMVSLLKTRFRYSSDL